MKSTMIPKKTVEAARDGDKAALETVLEEASDFIWEFVGSHVENDVDADEIAECVLERVWQYLPDFDSSINDFDAWLSKITWSQINEYRRRQGRDMEVPMSSVFYSYDEDRPLTYDEIEEIEFAEPEINYGPEAARELAEADAIFRGDWRERPRQIFLKYPGRKVIK